MRERRSRAPHRLESSRATEQRSPWGASAPSVPTKIEDDRRCSPPTAVEKHRTELRTS